MTEKSSVSAATSDPFAWPVEPYEVPPHPCNVEFLQAHRVHVVKTLGECLHWISEIDGVD